MANRGNGVTSALYLLKEPAMVVDGVRECERESQNEVFQ
jgi:hypothetical protein